MKKLTIPLLVVALLGLGLYIAGVIGERVAPDYRRDWKPIGEETGGIPADEPRGVPEPGEVPSPSPEAGGATAPLETPAETDGAAVEGRVIGGDGLPIEGAVVHLAAAEKSGEGIYFMGDVPALTSEEDATRTDAEGRFRYDGLSPADRFTLFVRAEGWVGERRGEVTPAGGPLEVVLEAGAAVQGVVIDPDRRGVPNAEVRAGPAVRSPRGSSSRSACRSGRAR